MIKDIVHQPDEAIWHRFRQLWYATDKEGLALEPRSAAALRDELIRIFMGRQAHLERTGLIALDISADTAEWLIESADHRVELVGFIDEKTGKLQCIASKAMAHDEFCNKVIPATTH